MDQLTIAILLGVAVVGVLASVAILRRPQRPPESPFATSTEGVKLCTSCGMANTWTDSTCASCGHDLPG